jgi:iron complex transport system ATP-binding protein
VYEIINKLDVEIPDGKVTSIIGPNGCGKSTLLKALSRLLAVKEGEVFLDGENIHTQSTKEISYPQQLIYQILFDVENDHMKLILQQLSHLLLQVIEVKLEVTGTDTFRHRSINDLSGGQRQRVWIAMALAQRFDHHLNH